MDNIQDEYKVVKKVKKKQIREEDSETEMYLFELINITWKIFNENFSVSEEEIETNLPGETVEKKAVVAESEVGLNSEIFGFLLKMKEKERLKLVTNIVLNTASENSSS